jgi:hypothetical protein
VDTILDWVEELSQTRVLGSKEPNALGIEGFNDEHLLVLQYLLQGLSLEEMRDVVRLEYQPAQAGDLLTRLEGINDTLRGAYIFKSLLGGSVQPAAFL